MTACGAPIGSQAGTPYVYTYTQDKEPQVQRAVMGETVVAQPEQVFHERCFQRVRDALDFRKS